MILSEVSLIANCWLIDLLVIVLGHWMFVQFSMTFQGRICRKREDGVVLRNFWPLSIVEIRLRIRHLIFSLEWYLLGTVLLDPRRPAGR